MLTGASFEQSRSRSTRPTRSRRSTPILTTYVKSGLTLSNGQPSWKCSKRRGSTSTSWRLPRVIQTQTPLIFCVTWPITPRFGPDESEPSDSGRKKRDFFDHYSPEARAIIEELLDKYAEHGTTQLRIPDVFEVPPISEHGNLVEIAKLFGGTDNLMNAVTQLQSLLYAA